MVKAEKREILFEKICNSARAFGVGRIEAEEIDQINILQATFKAARLALADLQKKLGAKPDVVLMDGNHSIPGIDIRQQAVISGDKLSKTIAAASILAKVTRDRWMVTQDKDFPGYDFARHKGYGTEVHRKALLALGPCSLHRKSFLKSSDTLALGRRGESQAVRFLEEKSFSILDRNWRTNRGEIDIIAERKGALHFVEVRSRSQFHEMAQVFPQAKQAKLGQLAELYLMTHPQYRDQPVQIDLLVVEPSQIEVFWNVLGC
jgi:uncharacterized protein (TIGR00252 family)